MSKWLKNTASRSGPAHCLVEGMDAHPVSPTTGAQPCRILRKVKLVPPPNQRPLSAWKGLRFLLMFPDDPRPLTVELAEQLLGLRPCPPVNYHISRPRPPVGAEWLDLQLWWNLVFYRQDRPVSRGRRL